jgi:hypothetical protein
MEYIEKNTVITCSRRHHPIGTLTEQIKAGDPLKFFAVYFFAGQRRVQGEPFNCRLCGSLYWLDGKLHTVNGWMPDDPKMEPVKPKPREMKATKLKLDPERKEAKQDKALKAKQDVRKQEKERREKEKRPEIANRGRPE